MNELRAMWSEPVFLRSTRGYFFLYHLSSLVMCLLILAKVWSIISTWSNETRIDWVMIGILLATSEITAAIHKAVIIPASSVSTEEGGRA